MKLIFKTLVLFLMFSLYSCAVVTGSNKMYAIKIITNPPAQRIEVRNLTTLQLEYEGSGGEVDIKLKAKKSFFNWNRYELELKRAGFPAKKITLKLNKNKKISYNFIITTP
jgi:hypothetical protein